MLNHDKFIINQSCYVLKELFEEEVGKKSESLRWLTSLMQKSCFWFFLFQLERYLFIMVDFRPYKVIKNFKI